MVHLDSSSLVPAVDDHGSSIGMFGLFSVHLMEEAEDTTRLLRDAMVRPAHVLIVPDGTTLFWLRGSKKFQGFYDKKSFTSAHKQRRVSALRLEGGV